MSWISTVTGRRIDFLDPQVDQIDIRDVACALSRNHRFAGHSPVKIGQHIVEVATLMVDDHYDGKPPKEYLSAEAAEMGLVGLIHDFPEFAVVDVPTPLKRLLGPVYAEIEERLLSAMLRKWELGCAYQMYADLLHKHDRNAVIQEALRFRLDGWIVGDDDEYTETDYTWVDPNHPVTLVDSLADENVAYLSVLHAFNKCLYFSGRWDMVSERMRKPAEDLAKQRNMPLADLLNRTQLPSFLLSGKNYF